MATVAAEMTMSLDGFIADPADGIDELFGWYDNGEVVTETATPDLTFRTSPASAEHLRESKATLGAIISGRRLFDITDGWGGRHPLDVPVFVVSHTVPEGWSARFPDAPFTFVTDGIESAVAQASKVAGDGVVGVGGAETARRCLEAGLLDEIRVNLAPVLLGDGIPFFAHVATAPVRLHDPRVIEGTGVVHLYYRVDNAGSIDEPRRAQ